MTSVANPLKGLARRALPARVWTSLRLAKLRWEVAHYRRKCVEHSFAGIRLKINLADPMAADWYDHDWVDVPELSLFQQFGLLENSRIFDIGAHQGVVAVLLAKSAGPSGRVVAVEPNPHNFGMAGLNRASNSADNLELVSGAAAARCGEVTLNLSHNGQVDDGAGGWGRLKVPAYSVDYLAEKYGPPDLVYVDVEGFEAEVLHGAPLTLKSHCHWFVEVHSGCGLEKFGGSIARVVSFFPENQFELHARAEADSSFAPLRRDRLPFGRFFLIAIARGARAARDSTFSTPC